MRLLFFLLLIACTLSTSAQKIEITLEELPLRKGVIYNWDAVSGCGLGSDCDAVTIYSPNDSCFSISSGTVAATFDLGGEYVVIIKTEENKFYTYAGFRSLAVQKKDIINKDSFLGNLKTEGDDYELVFWIANKNAKNLSRTLHLQYLKEANCEATPANQSSLISTKHFDLPSFNPCRLLQLPLQLKHYLCFPTTTY